MYKTMDDDTITIGELGVRFLVEAADSNGSAAVFECHVPAGSRMPAPHSIVGTCWSASTGWPCVVPVGGSL
jgi:hypothetical protein